MIHIILLNKYVTFSNDTWLYNLFLPSGFCDYHFRPKFVKLGPQVAIFQTALYRRHVTTTMGMGGSVEGWFNLGGHRRHAGRVDPRVNWPERVIVCPPAGRPSLSRRASPPHSGERTKGVVGFVYWWAGCRLEFVWKENGYWIMRKSLRRQKIIILFIFYSPRW